MRSIPELMLIEEVAERAVLHLQSVMTLVQLSFEEGEAEARFFACSTGVIIDPEATCYFEEARRLLLRPVPNLALALLALELAAGREPACYEPTRVAILALVYEAAHEAAEAELAEDLELEAELEPPVVIPK